MAAFLKTTEQKYLIKKILENIADEARHLEVENAKICMLFINNSKANLQTPMFNTPVGRSDMKFFILDKGKIIEDGDVFEKISNDKNVFKFDDILSAESMALEAVQTYKYDRKQLESEKIGLGGGVVYPIYLGKKLAGEIAVGVSGDDPEIAKRLAYAARPALVRFMPDVCRTTNPGYINLD